MDDDDRIKSEHRWRLALSDLDGTGETESERWPRRRVVARRWIVLGAVAVPLVVGALVFLARGRTDTSSGASDLPTWRAILGFSMQLGGLIVEFFGLERARRGELGDTALLFLTRGDRKALLAQVRGRTAPIPSQLPLARHLALRRSQPNLLVGVGAGLLGVGQVVVFGQPSVTLTLLLAAAIPVLAWGILFRRRELARALLFLDQNPDPASQIPRR